MEPVVARLRGLLSADPPSVDFDEECERWLFTFLDRAATAEVKLLPRRFQRALTQMSTTCTGWVHSSWKDGNQQAATRWTALAQLANDNSHPVDLHQLAEFWLQLVKPLWHQVRRQRHRNRYSKLSDIEPLLNQQPLELSDVENVMRNLRIMEPLDQRVAACILGVPHTDLDHTQGTAPV